jgi:hypothetical protein
MISVIIFLSIIFITGFSIGYGIGTRITQKSYSQIITESSRVLEKYYQYTSRLKTRLIAQKLLLKSLQKQLEESSEIK